MRYRRHGSWPVARRAGIPLLLVAALCVYLLAPAAVTGAQGDAERGARLFRIHCASCHGSEGRGDGPMVEYLKTRPANLRHLAERGAAWSDQARAVLLGQEPVGAHGEREMPVWGQSLVDRARVADQRHEVEAEIDALIAYLRTLQPKPGD